jgi:hypothetical protein
VRVLQAAAVASAGYEWWCDTRSVFVGRVNYRVVGARSRFGLSAGSSVGW